MVYDRISHLANYQKLLPNLSKLVEYLDTHSAGDLPLGEHRIDDDLILKVKEYIPREKEDARWESHRVFADVQYVVRGHELMGISHKQDMQPMDEYNAVSDSIHYDKKHQGIDFPLTEGNFMLLMPDDIHMPSLSDSDGRDAVFKIIAKVRI